MTTETGLHLIEARKTLGECARKVAARRTPLRVATNDQLILGIGTAKDFVRWAATLSDLDFSSKSERNATRKPSITESIRFKLLWTASDALFSKDAILSLSGATTLPDKELPRFEILYSMARIDPPAERKCVQTITNFLGMRCAASGVSSALYPGDLPVMWEVIDQKYSSTLHKIQGLNRKIRLALQANTVPSLSGPELLYANRNWAVHGMLLSSFLRGTREKFLIYIDAVLDLLGRVLLGVSKNLLSKL